MDLKQYRAQIKAHLLNSVNEQAAKEHEMATGSYKAKKSTGLAHYDPYERIARLESNYDDLLRKMNKMHGSKIDMTGHATANYDETPEVNVEQGGSFFGSIGKSISHAASSVGHSLEHTADKAGHTITKSFQKTGKVLGKDAVALGDQIKKTGIQKLGTEIGTKAYDFVKDNGTKLVQGAEQYGAEYGPEVALAAEEDAPLLLLAAGMKKPKRSRQTSQKEKNRHALIRKLMQQHGWSLAEASKHIKQNNLQY
jgi:hypothetical protein